MECSTRVGRTLVRRCIGVEPGLAHQGALYAKIHVFNPQLAFIEHLKPLPKYVRSPLCVNSLILSTLFSHSKIRLTQ